MPAKDPAACRCQMPRAHSPCPVKAGIRHRLQTLEGKCPGHSSKPDLRSESLASQVVMERGMGGFVIVWRQDWFSVMLAWSYKTSTVY